VKLHEAIRLAKHSAKVGAKYANVDHAKRFAQHVVPEVVRPARVIWNQAVGALFFVLAAPALLKAIQLYRTLDTDPKSSFGLGLSLVFVVVMVFFGVISFLKARRVGRQVTRPFSARS
jgi:hypothetical protein